MFKKNKNNKEPKKVSLKLIFFSLVAAISIFFVLIKVEASILEDYEKNTVVVALQEVKNGVEITNENVEDYFKIKDVDKTLITNNTVEILDYMIGYIVKNDISMGEIVSKNDLIAKSSILANIKEPIETSFKASDLSEVVGGVLRPGDLINISVINKETAENDEIIKNVYVSQSFDSSGSGLDQETEDKSALTINIIIDKEFESEFNSRINQGKVRVSKVSGVK